MNAIELEDGYQESFTEVNAMRIRLHELEQRDSQRVQELEQQIRRLEGEILFHRSAAAIATQERDRERARADALQTQVRRLRTETAPAATAGPTTPKTTMPASADAAASTDQRWWATRLLSRIARRSAT